MASSSTSSHSPSGSSSLSWNYDVFLSFRGEDTRKTFVDHLYTRLVEHGIRTYKDDKTLTRGESVGPALLKAIQESRIAIIVFSENYADSSWCLDELAYIMRCKDERGQIVLPVFYHVDPNDVRTQKGKYKEAFAKHELKNNNKVEYWRKALFDAGNLSGWVPKDTANGHESEVIIDIVGSVLNTLFPLSSYVNEDLVGMSIRLKELRSELELELGGVRMIGIWGMGGVGKTTLAYAIYAEISSEFDGCCFLENIREKSSKSGLETLQKEVLQKIFKEKNIHVGSVGEERDVIKSWLCHEKVLIVLDDVDHLDQLKMLAGSLDWFGEGSRIIITTRDKHLLNAHRVDVIYHSRLLNDDEALKLFCMYTPKQDYITTEDYEALSKAVVSYAHGLPLALKVLGSFLCDKDVNQWRSTLARLKDIPEYKVFENQKISYDGLEPVEKELFLDIACFHRGRYIEDLMMSMDACGFHPNIGIKVLIQKGLIIASKDMNDLRYSEGRFDMLDSIQEMGHYIVQGEHFNNPIKHSRVWREKDILSICSTNTANSDSIEALDLYTRKNCPQAFPHIVATMKNLRSVYWECYPQSLLPTNFQPTKLRCLILKGSSLIQLWEGYKNLPNLKLLDLTRSTNLIKTPDLGGLPRLERMILSHCSSLREVHPSTGCHEKLSFLNLDSCDMLEVFPSINGMPQLATFILSSCSRLLTFPNIQTNMDNLVDIRLRESGIKVLPSSIVQYCTNLVSLDLSHCNNLKRIEVDFSRLRNLKELHISGCTNLKTPAQNLFNVECCFLTSLFKSPVLLNRDLPFDICKLTNLQVLDLSKSTFSEILFGLVQLPRLKFLDISDCKSLVELPDFPSNICVLDANGCDSLRIYGDFPTTYKWLWKVTLGNKVYGGENVLRSMFQGTAINEDHFLSFRRNNFDIPQGLGFDMSTGSFAFETFTLQLPSNWYTDYSGFFLCVAYAETPDVMIVIKEMMHMDNQSRFLDKTEISRMCYIPFSSLMHQSLWNGNISFFIRSCVYKVELVPRRSKGGSMERSTDFSEFWDEQLQGRKTFRVQRASGNSVEITWLH